MAKYLDGTGLGTLWGQIKTVFLSKSGGTMTGTITTSTGNHAGLKVGDTYITSAGGGSVVFQNNTAGIRFGTDAWDYNQWAGLKYVHSSKIIYLGLADGTVFTANTAQSGGKLYTPGIDQICVGNGTYTVYHTGNLPAYPTKDSWNYDDRYLKLSGGTITNTGTTTPLTIQGSSSYSTIQFMQSGEGGHHRIFGITTSGELFVTPIDNWNNEYTILHTGNYSTYCATAGHKHNYSQIEAGNISLGAGTNYINLRTGHNNYSGGIYYSTPGNEATVFAHKNSITSWIFATTEVTGMAAWTGLTPSMQIKNGTVAINKLIANDASLSYNLDVNGTANATTLYEGGTSLASKYVDLSNAQTITGAKTFNAGKWVLAANESNAITSKQWGNGCLYDITDTSRYSDTAGIRNSIRFPWYSTAWVIGSIRGSDSASSLGFGICYENSGGTHHLDCFRVTPAGVGYLAGSKIWTAGNDGANSGLDADTLDGYHASSFSTTGHTHSYLPLAGGTMTGALATPKIRITGKHSSSNTGNGIYYFDGTTDYLLIGQGTSNLWIGANETAGTHHLGSTYISAGEGNLYVSKLVSGSRANHLVLDAQNYSSYALPLAGGTLTGDLGLLAGQYADSANSGALNANNSDIYGVNSIKFADLADSAAEGLQWVRDSTHVDSLWVKSGVMYFTPNRTWGGSATDNVVLHSGNYTSYAASLSHNHNDKYSLKFSYTLPASKGVRISYTAYSPVLISVCGPSNGSQLVIIGTGYGAGGRIRNQFTELVSCSVFDWSIPNSDSIACSVEIYSRRNSDSTVWVQSTGNITFTEIDSLTSTKENATLLTSSNYTTYAAKSGHNHDSTYLKLSGGTMTGTLTIGSTAIGEQLEIWRKQDSSNSVITFCNGASTKTVIGQIGISGSGATGVAPSRPYWKDTTTPYQLVHSTAKTQIGGTSTPVYVDPNGQIQAGTALGTASTHAHTDYVTSITYDSTNRILKQSKGGGTATNIVTFGSNAFDSTSYLPLTGGTLTGSVNLTNTNAKIAFGSLTTSPITGYKAPNLGSNGVGIYSRYGGSSDEGALIITEDTCVIYNSADSGWNFQVMDKDLGTDMTVDATRSFGVNQNHQAYSLGGFVKSGATDSDVLLGAGGHKAESSLNVATSGTSVRSSYQGRDTFIQSPKGGTFTTSNNSYTGYLRIKLPCALSNTMMSFFVDIYDYDLDCSVTYKIAGYSYTGGWVNTTAQCVSSYEGSLANLSVRFGTLDGKAAVEIGESNTGWSYPQVVVRDFLCGYSSATVANYFDSWTIDFSTTSITVTTYGGDQSHSYHANVGLKAKYAASVDWSGISNKPSYVLKAGDIMTGHLKMSGTKNLGSSWDPGIIAGSDGHDKVVLTYLASSTSGAVVGAHNSALSEWAPLNISGTSLIFRYQETEKMRMDSSGNFGIGTSSPSTKLHVNGDSTLGSKSIYYQRGTRGAVHHEFVGADADYGVMKIRHTSSVGSGSPGTYTATLTVQDERSANISGAYEPTFYINRSGATRVPDLFGATVGGSRVFTITSSGAVGIVNSTPAYSLDVNGDIYTNSKLVFPHGGTTYSWARINEGYNRTSLRAYCTAGESATGAKDNFSIGLMVDGYYSFALAAYGGGANLAWRNNSGTWYDIITSQNIGSQSVTNATNATYATQLGGRTSDQFVRVETVSINQATINANELTQENTLYRAGGDMNSGTNTTWSNFPGDKPAGGWFLMNISENSSYDRQIYGSYNSNRMYVRCSSWTSSAQGPAFGDWEELALVSGTGALTSSDIDAICT